MGPRKEKQDFVAQTAAAWYAVFEFYAESARVTLIAVAADGSFFVDRTLALNAPGRFSAGEYARTLRDLYVACNIPDEAQAIMVFDGHEAVVMQGLVSLPRADWNAEITMPELENAVRHGVWQLFQRDRPSAARFLKLQEMQLKLADATVMQLKLDGHKVISPIGFRSHTIDCLLRQTFVRAQPWQQMLTILASERIITVLERSGLWAGHAALLTKSDALFLDVGQNQTSIYSLSDGVVTYQDTVLWGTGAIFTNLVKQFGLQVEFAPMLIERYAARRVSDAVSKEIERVLLAEFAVLMHTIEARRTKKSVPVYVHSVVPLPPLLSKDKLMRTLGVSSPYIVLDDTAISPAGDPVVHYNKSVPRGGLSASYDTAVLVVWQVSTGSHAALVTKTAKQRARWISSQADVIHS